MSNLSTVGSGCEGNRGGTARSRLPIPISFRINKRTDCQDQSHCGAVDERTDTDGVGGGEAVDRLVR